MPLQCGIFCVLTTMKSKFSARLRRAENLAFIVVKTQIMPHCNGMQNRLLYPADIEESFPYSRVGELKNIENRDAFRRSSLLPSLAPVHPFECSECGYYLFITSCAPIVIFVLGI